MKRALSYRHGADATDSWIEDTNYLRFTATITEGAVLNIVSLGDDRNERRGSINCVQIVAVPPAPSHFAIH